MPAAGVIGMATQSGAFGSAAYGMATLRGIGLSLVLVLATVNGFLMLDLIYVLTMGGPANDTTTLSWLGAQTEQNTSDATQVGSHAVGGVRADGDDDQSGRRGVPPPSDRHPAAGTHPPRRT